MCNYHDFRPSISLFAKDFEQDPEWNSVFIIDNAICGVYLMLVHHVSAMFFRMHSRLAGDHIYPCLVPMLQYRGSANAELN